MVNDRLHLLASEQHRIRKGGERVEDSALAQQQVEMGQLAGSMQCKEGKCN